MFQKIYKELLILLAAFGIIWVAVSYLKLSPEAPDVGVSIEKEEELSEYITESIAQQYDEVESPYVDSCITVITQRLENAIDSTDYEYTFHVIENEQVNAFATLGGHIYIHTGLLSELESAEELSAVLAHEMGHIEHRHVVSKLVKELGITILFSVLTGNDPILLSEIMESLVSTAFDRSQESEADQFGLELLEKAHIQPLAMAHAFRKLKNQSAGSYIPEVVSTHPNINARIRSAVNFKVQDSFDSKPFEIDWIELQRQLEEAQNQETEYVD
jgi:predicted Zn-dependent protease